MSEAFWNGLWGGVFELIALGLVAGWVNLVYQRIRSRQDLRRDLIDEIDQFSTALYRPRKLYQFLLEQSDGVEANTLQSERLLCLREFTDSGTF